MPLKAAGIRQEPPVSVPSAPNAMPSANDTAAPDDEPPGTCPMLRSEGTFRRAEMRIDADAGIGEFGHVGPADHNEAGRAQPRHHRRVGLRGRGKSSSAREPARVTCPLDVEEILDRDRNASKRRRRRLGLAQLIHCVRGSDRGVLVDVNEGLAHPRPRDRQSCARHSSTSLRGGGTPGIEIGGKCGKCRMFRHGFLFRFLWRHPLSEATGEPGDLP